MLLIVDLSSKADTFPVEALQQVDLALSAMGFRKEAHSVIKPGKEFSATYDGPNIEASHVEEVLKPIAEQNRFTFTVDIEESIKFP